MLQLINNKTVQGVSAWLTIVGGAFTMLSKMTPEWFGALTVPQAIFVGIGSAVALGLSLAVMLLIGGIGYRIVRPRPTAPCAEQLPESAPEPPAADGLSVVATGTVRDVSPEEQLRRGIYVARIEADTSRLQDEHVIGITIYGFNGTHRHIRIADLSGAISTWLRVIGKNGRKVRVERILPKPVQIAPADALGIRAHSEFVIVLEQVLRPSVAAEMLAALGPETVELNLSKLAILVAYENDNPSVTTRLPLWNLGLVQADRLWTCRIVEFAGTATGGAKARLGIDDD